MPQTLTSTHRWRGTVCMLIAVALLVADQALKFWVKTNFYLGESMPITSWFQLVFVQNNGMAFGWEIGSKMLLTLLRIVAAIFLIYYMWRVCRRREAKTGYLVCLALIVAGAIGNIIDCVFYGLIFTNPYPPFVAQLVEPGQGYAPLFHGLVVDMFYFPLCSWTWPEWLPWIGGEHFIFFRPVFNLADSAISVGIVALILFYASQISEVPFLPATQAAADKAEEAATAGSESATEASADNQDRGEVRTPHE